MNFYLLAVSRLDPVAKDAAAGVWEEAQQANENPLHTDLLSGLSKILQMNPNPASMFAFSRPFARQTRGADRYQHLG